MLETYSYTGEQLAAQVEQKFGDSGNVQITRVMQLGWINNGQRAIVQQNEFLEKVATTNLLAGQAIYDMATLFASERMQVIIQITVNGKSIDIIPFPEYQALIANSGAAPSAPPTVGTLFADKLTLWPTPDETLAGAIIIYFRAFPADLTAITDKLTVPDRFYNALVDYVFAQALELDENFQASQVKLGHFQASVQREYEREHATPGDFYSGMIMDPYDDDEHYRPEPAPKVTYTISGGGYGAGGYGE